ncbi:hypothetical protein [Methanobrevibacter sp.]|uniref:hypothetical protein n=1 Tax=Methanobrevibacter sp. TaxID=66852 RepID=UPI0025CDA20F|nr:hypothetical protein [Methanobrevibacter sp.]MBQ2832590.1 hypothetical protein [Methanobrevibacter sp.]
MVKNNHKSIKQQLEEVQSLILENLYLQEKYPEKKFGLQLGLESLRDLETEMYEALKQEQVNKKRETWEWCFKGNMVQNGFIPMKEYGELLINGQDLITSLSSDPLNLNQPLPYNENRLLVAGSCSGSLRVLLLSEQTKLDTEESHSPINEAMIKLNKISNYEGDLNEFNNKENVGKKQMALYRNFVKSLSDMKLDFEVKKPLHNGSDKLVFSIDALKSLKIAKSFENNKKHEETTETVEGVIRAVDLDDYKFKIESHYGNRKQVIKSDFNKKDEEILASKLNKEACVELKNITEESVDKRDKSDYELLRVIR